MANNIHNIKPDTKIIALTGSIEELVLQDSAKKRFKFDYFFAKPVVFKELFAAIEQCFFEIDTHFVGVKNVTYSG